MPKPAPHQRSTPWREAAFCVVDLETTGLDPSRDEIVSFAALHVDRGRLRLDDAVYQLVHPERMPRGDTIVIHGLRSAELADAPRLPAALEELAGALAGCALVAHVAAVETRFLRAAGLRLRAPVVDTEALAAELFRRRGQPPRPRPYSLDSVADALNLPVHRPHEADGDALTTAQVFLALASHLDVLAPQTVGSLERLGAGRVRLPWRR
jgi:DNA polymerase III subunit epsilon